MQFKNTYLAIQVETLAGGVGDRGSVARRYRSWPMLFEHKGNTLNTIATDLNCRFPAKVEVPDVGDQATTVAARKLQDLLRALPETSEITIDAKDSKMAVKAGRVVSACNAAGG